MKASEAILRIIANQGGEIDSTQFNRWIGQLTVAGYLEADFRARVQGKVYYKLTEKADELLKSKGGSKP